jgi:deazaflavin-dependent oxidoreductase (nitroreductase family)
MAKQFRLDPVRRAANALLKAALRNGFGPKRSRLLEVRGRRTGRVYTTPVNLVFREGERYLVSPYGERNWVKNARAAGSVQLRRGKQEEIVRIEELPPAEAAPVLRQYLHENLITRPYFDAKLHDPDDALIAEAPKHPVFRLSAPK